MVVSCMHNMEMGGSSRQTESLLKILQAEGYLRQNERIPGNSTIVKYGRAINDLVLLQVNEFIENSQQLQIGFGESFLMMQVI